MSARCLSRWAQYEIGSVRCDRPRKHTGDHAIIFSYGRVGRTWTDADALPPGVECEPELPPLVSVYSVFAYNAFGTVGDYARLAAYENGDDDPLGHNFGPLCGRCGEPLKTGAVIAHGQSCGIR